MAHLIPPASSGFPVDVTAEATLGRPLGVVKFAATPGRGAYRLLLEAVATTHADFTDLLFLQSTTPAETETRARIIGTVRSVTRAFFDKTLKRIGSALGL